MNMAMLLLLFRIHPSSVCAELQLKPFDGLGDTVRVTGMLCGYSYEKNDGDYHLYLSDSNCEMIAEIMAGTPASLAFRALRKEWGSPETKEGINWQPIRITVTGLRYYDHEHFNMPERCYAPKT